MATGGWPLPDGPSPLLRTQAVSGAGERGPPGGRKLLQVLPGCGVVRGGCVMGRNGVPRERAVASTAISNCFTINKYNQGIPSEPTDQPLKLPQGRQMSLLQGAWICGPISLQAFTGFTERVQIVGAQKHMRPTQFLQPNWVRPNSCFQFLVIRSHQPHLQHPWDQKQSDSQNVTKKCQKSVHGSFQHKTANQKWEAKTE